MPWSERSVPSPVLAVLVIVLLYVLVGVPLLVR